MAQDYALAKASTRYEDDPYTWALEQVTLLEAGRLSDADIANIAEELLGVARSEYRSLESALTTLTQHLLKWDHQPERRSRSWVLTIREQRRRVASLLRQCPGLKSRLAEAMSDAYETGRLRALNEMQAEDNAIPEAGTYDFDELMDRPVELPFPPGG